MFTKCQSNDRQRVRKVRTEKPATLKTMRNIVAIEQIPYRSESQEQTFFETLVQRGRDNRFNGPFSVCQKRSVVGTVICQEKSVQTNCHRRQERGARNSGTKLQSNEAHSDAWFIR